MRGLFYLDLFAALERHGVRYLLVGGLAMNLHGVPRMTMDVDLLLALDGGNLERFFAVAGELGLRPALPVPLEALADPETRRIWMDEKHMLAFSLLGTDARTPPLDILISSPVPFDEAYQRRLSRQVGEAIVSLAAVDDMIALKAAAGRAQDRADMEHLKQLRHDNT